MEEVEGADADAREELDGAGGEAREEMEGSSAEAVEAVEEVEGAGAEAREEPEASGRGKAGEVEWSVSMSCTINYRPGWQHSSQLGSRLLRSIGVFKRMVRGF